METFDLLRTEIETVLDELPANICAIITHFVYISDEDRVDMLLSRDVASPSFIVRLNGLELLICQPWAESNKLFIGSTFGMVDNNVSLAGIVRRLKKRYWLRYLERLDWYSSYKQLKNQVAMAPLWEELYHTWLSL